VREAKRLFGPIGSGAILGGIAGGYATNFLAPAIGSHNMIFPAAACLGACLMLISRMWQSYGRTQAFDADTFPAPVPGGGADAVLPQILNSPQLRLMAAILATSVIAARLVDYQFNAIVSHRITDKDQLASFLGFWMSNLNLISLMIQALATRKIIQRFGVGVSLFFLPWGILLGAAATLVHPALWSAVMIKLGEGGFKNSLNKSGMELLFLTVPKRLKSQAKSFIDIFVDAAAGGLSGVLLILLVYWLNIRPAQISLVIFAIILFWFFLIKKVRKAYIQAFSDKLCAASSTQDLPDGPIPGNLKIMERIAAALDDSDPSRILAMLRMTAGHFNESLVPSLRPLLSHPDPRVATAALSQLDLSRNTDVSKTASALVRSEDLALRTEAVRYLLHRSDTPVRFIQRLLDDEDFRISSAAMLCLVRHTLKSRRFSTIFDPERMVETELLNADARQDRGRASSTKQICAAAIRSGELHSLYPYLYLLMEDTDPDVVTAAIQAAGETRAPQFIRMLLSFLSRRSLFRKAAVTALKCYGDQILDLLEDSLSNPYMAYTARKHIPEILAASGSQRAVDILSGQLIQPDLAIRYEIIRALNRLRAKAPALVFNTAQIIPKVKKEADDYMELLGILYAQKSLDPSAASPSARNKAREQLIRGLESRLDESLERMFRLLGLKYPPTEIYNAWRGIRSGDEELRLNAMEFLDNLLDGDLKTIIMPVVETWQIPGRGFLPDNNGRTPDPVEAGIRLLQGQDDLLKQKTLNYLIYTPDDRYIPHLAALLNSQSRGVRHMARMVLNKTGRFNPGTRSAAKGRRFNF
ncbi:MAG TPA: hypothetical protein DHV36_24500, partial [Desulfobacteraceae bacterium]|nr:hypothetical protein [Desulfobacteraceae bacterium]